MWWSFHCSRNVVQVTFHRHRLLLPFLNVFERPESCQLRYTQWTLKLPLGSPSLGIYTYDLWPCPVRPPTVCVLYFSTVPKKEFLWLNDEGVWVLFCFLASLSLVPSLYDATTRKEFIEIPPSGVILPGRITRDRQVPVQSSPVVEGSRRQELGFSCWVQTV